MNRLAMSLLLGAAAMMPLAAAAQNDDSSQHPGEEVYKTYCAMCHDNPEQTRAPGKDALQQYPRTQIRSSLISGVMQAQGGMLSSEEIEYVADYLGLDVEVNDSWIEAMACPAERATPSVMADPSVSTFGFDLKNSRVLSYEQTGLEAEDFGEFELAWAIGFPKAVSMRSQAAVVGTSLFLPVGESDGRLFAFDISESEPCLQWVYENEITLRSSASFGILPDGRETVFVGDRSGSVHAIDAETGDLIWKGAAGLFDASMITGTPVLVGDKVFVPSSMAEIMMGANNAHECCKTHGGVVALDAMTGELVWDYHTMPMAEPVRDRGDGKMLYGPSGAPVWNSPSIDLARGQLYIGTGEATSPPAHVNTDALIAVDLETGEENWAFQATANDIYLVGCRSEEQLNCVPRTETVYRDVDFGASTILAVNSDGQDLVLGGQKSGTVWAMNADTGEVVWRRDIGTGGPSGGIHWGIAADDTHAYAPISFPGRDLPDYKVPDDITPGLYAVNIDTGEIDWVFNVEASCDDESKAFTPRCEMMYGLSGAPSVIGDFVVTGGLDGWLYVLDKTSGELIWKYQTARAFETLNGIDGNGGAIDNASIVAANGMLFANSGYGLFGAGAGNVMLAFKPKSE
ncbi:MAG: hypothetical protein CMK07_05785 [Ponticaulis sp.]|nr:hypothetical protein [Ponticaulis sp.]